jgi:tRNA(Ile)-lysidine synthase
MAGEAVTAICAELDRLTPGGAIGVAVSGGGDSTALLVIARDWAQQHGRRVEAATVDHGLRAESAAEASAVAALCTRMGIAHQILRTGSLREAGGNLSAVAREARFSLLGDWAHRQGLSAVLLGHTMDDQAETVLMRLARGSGAEGLSAMQASLRRSDMLWLRPMLGIRREALRELLCTKDIPWTEDPTNEDTEYDRVKARAALAALAPLGIDAEGLARTAAHLQRQRRVLERAMHDLAERVRKWGALGEARLDLAALSGDEPDTAMRLLADSLCRVSGAVYRPRFRALTVLYEGLLAEDPPAATLSGCLIRPEDGTVVICREPNACAPSTPLDGASVIWDRRWRVELSGTWPAGVLIGALGEQGLASLQGESASGAWVAPQFWASAPRALRQTTPAIWLTGPANSVALLAAPVADYVNRREIGSESTVLAQFIGTRELP